MTQEALRLALEALEEINKLSIGENAICLPAEIDTAMDAIKEALAQTQEPVAWSYWQSCLNDDGTQTAPWVHRLSKFKPTESIINKDVTPLYTTPPKRTWVGLTDEEYAELAEEFGPFPINQIEAKLKQKNTHD